MFFSKMYVSYPALKLRARSRKQQLCTQPGLLNNSRHPPSLGLDVVKHAQELKLAICVFNPQPLQWSDLCRFERSDVQLST